MISVKTIVRRTIAVLVLLLAATGSIVQAKDTGPGPSTPEDSQTYQRGNSVPRPVLLKRSVPVRAASLFGQPAGRSALAAGSQVLWDQPLNTPTTEEILSTEFTDPDAFEFSSYAADDFIVDQPWKIDTLFIPGDMDSAEVLSLMNADGLTFLIYADLDGKPAGDPGDGATPRGAPPVWSLTLLPDDPQVQISFNSNETPVEADVTLTLASPIHLAPGHYWLVFYPTLIFSANGQYYRQGSSTSNNQPAQWVNPLFGTGYGAQWIDWRTADPDPQNPNTLSDLAFRIEGSINYTVYLPLILR